MRTVSVVFALGFGLLSALLCAGQPPAGLDARRKALADLLAEQWDYRMRTQSRLSHHRGRQALQ